MKRDALRVGLEVSFSRLVISRQDEIDPVYILILFHSNTNLLEECSDIFVYTRFNTVTLN